MARSAKTAKRDVGTDLTVEVVVPCESCGGDLSAGCAFLCDGKGTRIMAKVAPGSISEAQLRLARACVHLVTVGGSIPKEGENPERTSERYDAAVAGYRLALAAVLELLPK